ncbi:hypothetical protein EVAR_55388_1 [Eumeta japonica]|uniref:Uncharacterized protein n=1 Tax=Eumeta variegata TaxID=151549 RepID=A0A4C1YSB2_EUMVA|nr:hypothetical protein EVAR_55388_1 [Eumeta japonica]
MHERALHMRSKKSPKARCMCDEKSPRKQYVRAQKRAYGKAACACKKMRKKTIRVLKKEPEKKLHRGGRGAGGGAPAWLAPARRPTCCSSAIRVAYLQDSGAVLIDSVIFSSDLRWEN